MAFPFFKRKRKSDLHSIAFYNLENLFDTVDDPDTLDDDFTPKGEKKWSMKRYKRKLYKLAKTISEIGANTTHNVPVLVGVAEVENAMVIEDLLTAEPLKDIGYGYVHYDSPDERGIDAALIYRRKNFKVLHSEPITLFVNNPDGKRDTTRDILYVHGELNGEPVHVFVNHWPSRRDGETETGYKRIRAAETLTGFMEGIEREHANPNYIIMGDFNDNPDSPSIRLLMQKDNLYNPAEKLLTEYRGSANYRRQWEPVRSDNFFP